RWDRSGESGSGLPAEEGKQAVLLRSVVRDGDLRAADALHADGVAPSVGLRPQPVDFVGGERLVLARGPGDVPGVDDQVGAEELVDGLLDAGAAEVAVVLLARPLRVVQQVLHRGDRLGPG